MENMETKDIVTSEAIEEITEAIPAGKNGMKTVAKIGTIGAVSIAAWEFAVKPIVRKAKAVIANRNATKKPKKNREDDVDMDEELDSIPELDD